MNDYEFILFDNIKNNDEIDIISAFEGLKDVCNKEEKLMAKNNEKKEEIKEEVVKTPVEEVKAENPAPAEEVKDEAPKKEVKAEPAPKATPAKNIAEKVPSFKKEVTASPVVVGKDETKYPPVQEGKKRVNVYANGMDLSYITYPFTGVKKAIVLELEDIKKLCWHKVPVEEIKADGTIVKLTLENYDK